MNEARQRDEDLAKLIEQSRQLGPMTSEEQREQRIGWVYGNCKLSNSDVTREMVENAMDTRSNPSHMDGHLAALSEREAPMIIRPVSAYADDEPPLDPPTQEDLDARRKWADRPAALLSTVPPRPSSDGELSPHIIPDGLKITDWRWWGTGANLDFKQDLSMRKLNIKLHGDPAQPDRFCDACHDQQQGFGKCSDHTPPPSLQPPPYINPLAALRRERKVKSGKAAKLLGISRQRLHVVEHSSKPLRCMDRLLAKAAEVWLVDDESTTTATPSATPTVMAKELGLSRKESC